MNDIKIAFKMCLKAGCEKEYERRHNEIWPELKQLLADRGITDYSIFLDSDTSSLFAVQRINGNIDSQSLSDEIIVRKWWNYMSDLLEVNPDNSPISVPLKELFYME